MLNSNVLFAACMNASIWMRISSMPLRNQMQIYFRGKGQIANLRPNWGSILTNSKWNNDMVIINKLLSPIYPSPHLV